MLKMERDLQFQDAQSTSMELGGYYCDSPHGGSVQRFRL